VIAAPIAVLMIEKYLKGKTSRPYLEKSLMAKNLQPLYDKQLKIEQQIAPKK